MQLGYYLFKIEWHAVAAASDFRAIVVGQHRVERGDQLVGFVRGQRRKLKSRELDDVWKRAELASGQHDK